VFGGLGGQLPKVRERGLTIEVEAEVRRLDRDLGVEPRHGDAVEHLEIVLRHRPRLGPIVHILPEGGEHRGKAPLPETTGRHERRVEGLPRHEPGDAPANEPVPRQMFAQPPVVRRPQDRGASDRHRPCE
jgi:hypothetical protein